MMMKRQAFGNFTVILLLVLLTMAALLPSKAQANSAAPPSLSIIVHSPPDDLEICIKLADGSTITHASTKLQKKVNRVYYNYYTYHVDSNGAEVVVKTGKQSLVFPLPNNSVSTYSRYFTLDLAQETLILGEAPIYRSILLIFMRIALTLLIEGLIFYAFGFRTAKHWRAFFTINLFTQGILNIILSGGVFTGYLFRLLLTLEAVIYLVETAAFLYIFRKEETLWRLALFTFAANAASFVLGGLLIMFLPI